jgi:hypothetical protein
MLAVRLVLPPHTACMTRSPSTASPQPPRGGVNFDEDYLRGYAPKFLQSNSMEKSSQIAWKIVPLRHFFPLKVVPLIEVLLYMHLEIVALKS